MAQTGMHGDPEQGKIWRKQSILDDPVQHSNSRGSVSFAMSGKNTRTTQIFFNTVNNKFLDGQGFAPFATIESGMELIDGLYNKYGEGGRGDGTDGRGPSQGRINQEGNAYLNKVFPELSYIVSARIVS
jgi:cyclophilin family peptidyl-prolyl cis-trans isomerase